MEDVLEVGQWIAPALGWAGSRQGGLMGMREQPKMKKGPPRKNFFSTASRSVLRLPGGVLQCEWGMEKQMNCRFGPSGNIKSLVLCKGRRDSLLWAALLKILPSELPQLPCMPVQSKGCSQRGAGNNLENSKVRRNFSIDFSAFLIRPWVKQNLHV